MKQTHQMPGLEQNKLLVRPRIDELLSNIWNHSLTSIVAGAGYGKTQSVLSYLSRIDADITWIQMTDSDNYTLCFWQGFIQAVSVENDTLSEELLDLDFPDELSKFHQFLKIFSNELYNDKPFIIVFDDCHLIHNQAIIKFIENLILANMENLSIIMLSRAELEINYSNLTDKNIIYYIESDQLAFTYEETLAYFQLLQLDISDEFVHQIQLQTEGWPFSIYLISLYVKRGGNISGNPVTYTMPIIMNMIETEIFSLYPVHIQYNLVKLSILNDFSLGLIKEIAGEHLFEVMNLLETNMFINYNAHTKRYYFHHLFLEFLTEKHTILSPDEITDVYRKAAIWNEYNNQKLDALFYYRKCNDYEEMWRIIWSYNPGRFSTETTDLFIDIIQHFPESFVNETPMTKVILACLHNAKLDINTAIISLKELIAELDEKKPTDKIRVALGEAYIMLAFYSLTIGTLDFKEYFIKANTYLPEGSTMFTNKFFIVNSDYAFHLSTGRKGELVAYMKAMFETMPYAEAVLNGSGYGREYLALAEANYHTGNMKKAMEYVYHAIYKGMDKEQLDIVCSGYYLLSRISVWNGNYEETISYLEQLNTYAAAHNTNQFFTLPDIAEGWFFTRIEHDEFMAGWIDNEVLYNQIHVPLEISRDRLLKVYVMLTKGQYSELIEFTNDLEITYKQRYLYFSLIYLYIFKALAYFYLKDYKSSIAYITEAYRRSYKNYIIAPYIEMGSRMTEYIEYLKEKKPDNISSEWIELISNKAGTYSKRLSYIKTKYEEEHKLNDESVSTLTEREKEILQSLCQGLTRDEIADTFDISINTVKYTLKNIYAKLGAINGIDAARIATLRGIVK